MSSPRKTRQEASEEEAARYFQAANIVQSALDDAITLLDERRMAPGVTSNERSLITSKFADLEADAARMQSEVRAFQEDQTAIVPPSQEDVAAIRVIAAGLDNMTEDAVEGESVLTVTTELLSAWRGIE